MGLKPRTKPKQPSFDTELALQIRTALGDRDDVVEKFMFGGIAFMVGGNMCCGVIKSEMCARVGAAQADSCLARPEARPMDFTGRPMRGWLYVRPGRGAAGVNAWVKRCLAHATSLPPK